MSRTADPCARCRQKLFPLVLLMIAFCLGAHFLLEDTLLYGALEAASQSCSSAELAYEEMEHLDDLGLVAHPPELIQSDTPPAMPAWSPRPGRQLALPVRIPPKIA
jgi:hypothetical protein